MLDGRTRLLAFIITHFAAVFLLFAPSFGQAGGIDEWELALSASDADLSPDDRMLAVTLESPNGPHKRGDELVESVELWDYRQRTRTARAVVATYPFFGVRPSHPVRFTADGLLLVVADPMRLYLLTANTLKTVRIIEPTLPVDFAIGAMETSPIGHSVVIAAQNGVGVSGVLFAYDLDTGQLLLEWKPPIAVMPIAWKPDGTQFAVAVAHHCTSIENNVHVFGTNPWTHLKTLTAIHPQSLAFSDTRLYSVQTSFCKGALINHHLGMEVFDTSRWHRAKTVFLPNKDIHDSASFSNGRLLVDTGTVHTHYDWSDFVSVSGPRNTQFTVWEGDTQSVAFTSATISPPEGTRLRPGGTHLRLSRTGKMVLLSPQHARIFQLP